MRALHIIRTVFVKQAVQYKSLSDDNINNDPTNDVINWTIFSGGGSGYEIGDYVFRSLPSEDAGKHLADGALLTYGSYQAFIDYIGALYADNPSAAYFTTEATWQSTVTTYGSCGKFVYDDVNKTVRLPKVSNILHCTTDATALGDLVQAGLPNITGTIYGNPSNITQSWGEGITSADGVFGNSTYVTRYGTQDASATGTSLNNLVFNASLSNSIYGASTTVQPQTIKGLLYIVVANKVKTDIEVDIDEIATDLNGKADTDLTNTTNSGKVLIAHNSSPSATYKNLTLGASGTTYTAPSDGYVQFVKGASAINEWIALSALDLYDGTSGSDTMTYSQAVAGQILAIFIPVRKGATFIAYYTATGATAAFKFIYAEGSTSEYTP